MVPRLNFSRATSQKLGFVSPREFPDLPQRFNTLLFQKKHHASLYVSHSLWASSFALSYPLFHNSSTRVSNAGTSFLTLKAPKIAHLPTAHLLTSTRALSTATPILHTQIPAESKKCANESLVPLEVALTEALEKLGLADKKLEHIQLNDLQLKAKLLAYLMHRSKANFTPLGISSIHTAADILLQKHLNETEPVVMNPVADWFLKSIKEGKFTENLRFVPYDRKNRKLNRKLY